jgi:Tetracyclin repressor-like, C-terminal domain
LHQLRARRVHFDDQNANEDFIRLVMVENIHEGVHLAKSQAIDPASSLRGRPRGGLASRGVQERTVTVALKVE